MLSPLILTIMVRANTIISSEAPNFRNALWIKPTEGGFSLYCSVNGGWQPLKLVDDNNTISLADDIAQSASDVKTELIGSVQDESTANTINGAKKYAESIGGELVGDATDAPSNMTLHGLKNYIDEQIAGLG